MRCASTRVLPDPAPATMSSGVPSWTTAARCCGLSPSSRRSSAPAAPVPVGLRLVLPVALSRLRVAGRWTVGEGGHRGPESRRRGRPYDRGRARDTRRRRRRRDPPARARAGRHRAPRRRRLRRERDDRGVDPRGHRRSRTRSSRTATPAASTRTSRATRSRRSAQAEQTAAAKAVGVDDVRFLGYTDGELVVSLDLRRDITPGDPRGTAAAAALPVAGAQLGPAARLAPGPHGCRRGDGPGRVPGRAQPVRAPHAAPRRGPGRLDRATTCGSWAARG